MSKHLSIKKPRLNQLNKRLKLRGAHVSDFQEFVEKEIGDITQFNIEKNIPKGDFATLLVNLLSRNIPLISSEGTLYHFDGWYYRIIKPIVFRQLFRRMWLKLKKASDPIISKNGFKEILIENFDEEIDQYIDNYPHLIPFKNGYYNDSTKAFEECSQDTYLTSSLPYDYNEKTNCPLFIQTMKEILPDEKDRIKYLTFVRTCFTSKPLGKALIALGDGNNGKSSASDFFIELMGDVARDFNVADAAQDKGAVVRLKGVYLAVSNEIGGNYMNSAAQERFKSWITNKFLSGRDAYGISEHWRNTVTFLFNTNRLAKVTGGGKAFFRRFIFVFFNEDFTGREDKNRFDRILKNEGGQVISYILNNFSDTSVLDSDWHQIRDIWNTMSNPLVEYIADCCVKCEPGKESSTSEIYIFYVEWCEKTETDEVISKKKFNAHMLRLNHPVENLDLKKYFYPKLRLITTQDKIEEIKNTPLPDEMPKELEETEEIKESRNPMEVNEDYFKKHYV